MAENQNTIDAKEIRLDRKSKILFIFLGILIIGSVAVTYWRYMVKRDYIVQAQIDCDPEIENCFIWQCDPMSLEEGEKCTGVPDNDIWYFKIFNRNAKNIPDCDPKDENCLAYVCGEGENGCSEELCDPENSAEGEECSTPEQYLLENPPVEEGEECAEDDEACLAEQENVECEEGDEECLAEQESAECDPESEECEAPAEECAPGDEECTAAEEEPVETDEENAPLETEGTNADENVVSPDADTN